MTELRIAGAPAIGVLLSLLLPALSGAETGSPPLPPDKLSLQTPPPPGAESVVPLLGGLESPTSPWRVKTASEEPTPPIPVCTLAQCDPRTCPLGQNSACLLQTFADIEWRLCVYASQFGSPNNQSNKGLEIGPVYLRRLFVPGDPWQLVLYRAGLAEVFTVYHRRRVGNVPKDAEGFYETAYLDRWSHARQPVTPADAGSNGALITLAQDASFGPAVVGECRDRGLAWLCKDSGGAFVRRGQELVIWGILDTGNYDFITEYGFRDDGTITMRVGATGWNNKDRPAEAHMHDALWRIDLDLDGSLGDSAYLSQHYEPDAPQPPATPDGLQATDLELPFNGGDEGAATWDPLLFTSLLVEDAAVNALGAHLGYELEPHRTGSARHYGQLSGFKEDWSKSDFWVTQWHPWEDTAWAVWPWRNPEVYLSDYVSNRESIANQDVVLWYLASGHHHPTDEDRDSVGNFAVTLTHWFGLELHPHNLFDRNPLGAPQACGH